MLQFYYTDINYKAHIGIHVVCSVFRVYMWDSKRCTDWMTTHIACSGATSEEVETQRVPEAVVQHFQHGALHVTYPLVIVRVVCDVDKVPHFRGIHLLVLAGNQHGRDPHQLKLWLVTWLRLQMRKGTWSTIHVHEYECWLHKTTHKQRTCRQ